MPSMKLKQLHIIFRKILAGAMILLLILLTCIHLFIYNNKQASHHTSSLVMTTEEGPLAADGDANQPAGPDEKTPDRSVSISEEYVHEQEEAAMLKADKLIHTLLSIDKKISPVHFELISPPPDQAG